MTEAGTASDATRKEILKDIQGDLIGFNKDRMRLVPFNFADAASGRPLLRELEPQLASGYEVVRFNAVFSSVNERSGQAEQIVQATWANLWLSKSGLAVLEAPDMANLPEDFGQGMAQRAAQIGDANGNEPASWVAPFAGGAEPHAVLVLAADRPDDLEERHQQLSGLLRSHGAQEGQFQPGETRPGDQRGHEHFGFKDGISQPGIDGLTTASKGRKKIAKGVFLIGYADEQGTVSGQPPSTPAPAPTPYNPSPPPPPAQPYPAWTHNGSFVVYRRLRQDVAAFNSFLESKAAEHGLSADQLGAKFMGRWKSGAPLARVPGMPRELDPSTSDPSTEYPQVLESGKINRFDFEDDPEGQATPRASHIRKTNTRADVLPEGDKADFHRMLRRGITYGPELQPGEGPYGEQVPDTQDRGLLFVSYQSSIADGFEFVQARWANNNDFQAPRDGKDPIIAQDADGKEFHLTSASTHVTMIDRWVKTTGGAYFFSPSLTGIRTLAGQPGDEAVAQ